MPRPLSAEPFAAYGDLFETPAEPVIRAVATRLDNRRLGARPVLLMARVVASALPFEATAMERHPHSSQTFVPIEVASYLVLVAPSTAEGGPDMARAVAFLANGEQGINYHAGTWHHPITAFEGGGAFAVLMWRDGGTEDVQRLTPPVPVTVAKPPAGRS